MADSPAGADLAAAYSQFVGVDNWLFDNNGDIYNAALIADGVALGRGQLTLLNKGAIIVDAARIPAVHPVDLAMAVLGTDPEVQEIAELVSGCARSDAADVVSLRIIVQKALRNG